MCGYARCRCLWLQGCGIEDNYAKERMGLEVEYEKIALFRKRMEVEIPKGFIDMPDYLAKKKYPSKYRPPVILMSRDTIVNYSFNLMEVSLPKEQLLEATNGFYKNMKKTKPWGRFGDVNILDTTNGKKAFFTYESPTVDEDIYGVIYVTDIEGKLLYGGFVCLLHDKDIWEEIALHSILSIREIGGLSNEN